MIWDISKDPSFSTVITLICFASGFFIVATSLKIIALLSSLRSLSQTPLRVWILPFKLLRKSLISRHFTIHDLLLKYLTSLGKSAMFVFCNRFFFRVIHVNNNITNGTAYIEKFHKITTYGFHSLEWIWKAFYYLHQTLN